MITARNLSDLASVLKNWRGADERIAFVPTMGNLHAGHLQLVKVAKTYADKVVVSIFVNPSQFGVGEDFDKYPRTEKADQDLLRQAEADLLFLPAVADIYPDGGQNTRIIVDGLSELHCGASRPGHFSGVATVVCKLFNLVRPQVAIFGRKDYQQLAIIRTLVKDLNMPIGIVGVDTVREASGLALSSRNGYLSPAEKAIAPKLYQALINARAAVLEGNMPYTEIEQEAETFLRTQSFEPDYFNICRNHDLAKAQAEDKNLVILAAAKLGKTRLIDNLSFNVVAEN